jgi:membrane-associated protease RseP (regulator of RpoE activity)
MSFAVTLMAILLSHECAHYAASRAHGVSASLPYFIPRLQMIGTMGAFIKMKSPIITRRALIDIGASGPIAGFIVAVAACVIGFVPCLTSCLRRASAKSSWSTATLSCS